jgi:hypothetical protein
VRDLAGTGATILRMPYREAYGVDMHDFRRRVPCLDRQEKLLGVLPRRPLEAIVGELLAPLRPREGVALRS